uniref:Uncharacterized protein n=1 Tax=Toxoplasma gondii COUG TaxID=1074873 RepID=A0A2G8XPF4_TOXGO|nr:hypothetical protein TGCOUG_309550 [Toxoplasma gondii COUG]
MQRSSGVPEHTDKKLNEPLPNWHLRNRRLASSDASRTTAEYGTIGSRAEKWQNRLPPSYQLKQMQTVLKQMQVLETDPKKVAPPSLRMEPSRGSHEGATAQFDANKYLFRPDETVHTNVATEDTRFQTAVLPKTRNTLDTPEADEYLGSLPFVLPLYSSNFAAETPYMNTSQLLLTEEPPLPALTRYYTQLGNITTLYPLIHNVTPPIDETIGIDTVTTFLQSVLDEDMRNRIVAATPPRVFGRVEELFWGTAVRFWRAWVDSWRDLKENPPRGWGWKREEAEGYRNIYNEFASWAYDAPFSLYDMLFNATILYSFPILQTRGDAIARRDEVLARDMEKQAIFYAPIFYSSMSIMQVGNENDMTKERHVGEA